MKKNLKKRIITSIILLSLLTFCFFNTIALPRIVSFWSIFSFRIFKIILIIFKDNKIKQFLINLLFFIFILTFCSLFFVFTYYLHLKILIFVVLITCIFSDIGGFVIGKWFKGTKLTKISPKTISGAIGSIIFSSIFIFLQFSF